MKKQLLVLTIFLCTGFIQLWAQEASVVYVDGWVDIKDKSGSLVEAWEGDPVYIGESVITDLGSHAELEKEDSAAIIKIAPDTVFTLREIDEDGEKRTVLATTLGSVSYKFNRTLGREPYISTPSIVAGVRGTEFTVFAGADGSTLVAVESGQVDVTAEGETVELYPEEGVEVLPGETPGEKFEVLRGKIDYSQWNREKFNSFLDDPVEGMKKVRRQLNEYISEVRELHPEYEQVREQMQESRKEYRELRESDEAAAQAFYAETVEPLVLTAGRMYKNLRYYSLSGLSMRRFILGRLYMEVKSRYITDLTNPVYLEFISIYDRTLGDFEDIVMPLLVAADM